MTGREHRAPSNRGDAWAVSGIETYDRLVLQAGWSHEEYEQWLGDRFVRTLRPGRTKCRQAGRVTGRREVPGAESSPICRNPDQSSR
jgi:hypothetical protein